tara:strand:+ start:104 stop:574 length:471 start_codon:yes stop_codon:yes gene_type:complete
MKNLKAEIQKQIDTLQNKVDVLNQKYTPEQIKDECDFREELMNNISKEEVNTPAKKKALNKWMSYWTPAGDELSGYRNMINEIELLKESLDLDLIEVTKRYLVTNAKELVSPSGFHPSDHVFIQPKLAIQVNNLKNVPATNVQLHAFDMNGSAYSI